MNPLQLRVVRAILFSILSIGAQSATAAQPTPAYLQKDVLKAALAIQLTEAQQPQFREALSTFVDGRTAAYNKLARRRNVTDVPRKLKSKTNRLLKKMDESVAGFLTPEQMPAYQNYRALLKANL